MTWLLQHGYMLSQIGGVILSKADSIIADTAVIRLSRCSITVYFWAGYISASRGWTVEFERIACLRKDYNVGVAGQMSRL